MVVLVTGSQGWIGRHVCAHLSSIGVDVLGLGIGPIRGGQLQCSQYLQVDITEPLGDLGVSSRVDAVIHCAGYAHRPNEAAEDQEMFYAVNRDGTQHVLNWCEREGVDRFLYISTIAFYDWAQSNELLCENGSSAAVSSNDLCVDKNQNSSVAEIHPISLPTHYAKSKYEGEQLVAASSLDWAVVRLATVFGVDDRANFARMANAMKKRVFPIPGEGTARKSVIPISLAAELIALFALMDNPPHRLINMGLPKAPTLREIADSFHKVCKLPRCPVLPMPVARTMGFCGDLAAKVLRKFPFTTNTLGKLTTSTEVSVDRMLECFPDREFGSFEDYLSECHDWYQSV